MVKIIDKRCSEALYIWHGKTKDPDIYFKYAPLYGTCETFSLTTSECEELYCKLGELIIQAKNYKPLDDEDD